MAVTAEGDLAIGSSGFPHTLLILDPSDLSVKDSSFTSVDDVFVTLHPSGNLVIVDQGDDTIALVRSVVDGAAGGGRVGWRGVQTTLPSERGRR